VELTSCIIPYISLCRTVYETDIYKRRLTDHARFVNIAQCMLRSLQFMHKKGVIHRDVKVRISNANQDSPGNQKILSICNSVLLALRSLT